MFKYSIKRKQHDNTSEDKSKQTQYEAYNYMSKHPVSMQEEQKETRAAENYANYSIYTVL